MVKKEGNLSNQGIQATNVNAEAIAIGKGAKAIVHHQNTNTIDESITVVFRELHRQADTLPKGPEKEIAQTAINELEKEANEGEKAQEKSVEKWMLFLAQAAPDIWEVAISTFLNPIAGLSLVFKKVAERAKGEISAAGNRG